MVLEPAEITCVMVIIYIEEESYATEVGKGIKETVKKSLNSLYENLNIHILSHQTKLFSSSIICVNENNQY